MDVKDFLKQKFNGRRLVGQTMMNASGDIDQSSLGYQIAITTLTFIKKKVTEHCFYEVAPADYVPIAVGDGAFSQAILTNLSFDTSGAFEAGIINQGSGNDRLAAATAAVGSKTVQVVNWAKTVGYTLIEVEQALQANNWDYIEQLHRSRKKNWDLGIQEIAFLGALSNSAVKGILTNSNVNINTSLITKTISSMSAAEFSTFVAGLIAAYRANCNYTKYPTHFIIPENDYNGLMAPVSDTYPIISKMSYLKQAFEGLVKGGVKILPLVYCQQAFNSSRGVNKNRYLLFNFDEESVRMDIPVDYTTTQPNTVNNFQFQDSAYGQFTGVEFYREMEALYFDWS